MTHLPEHLTPVRRIARAGVVITLLIGLAVVAWLARVALPVGFRGWSDWAHDTDPVSAVLPLVAITVIAVGIGLVLAAGAYAGLRALGLARTAAAFGWVVAPRLRRRIDQMIAVGVLTSVLTCIGAPSIAHAQETDGSVVREPVATAPMDAPGIVREPDPAPMATPSSTDVVVDPIDTVIEPTIDDPTATTLPTTTSTTAPQGQEPHAQDSSDGRARGDIADVVRDPDAFTDPAAAPASAPVRDGLAVSAPALPAARDDDVRYRRSTRSSADASDAPTTSKAGASLEAVRSGADPAASSTPQATASTNYTVRSGDNLWVIAAQRVAEVRGVDAASLAPADIAPYWAQVVQANRSVIRSGNPSLIYAGEILTMPAGA